MGSDKDRLFSESVGVAQFVIHVGIYWCNVRDDDGRLKYVLLDIRNNQARTVDLVSPDDFQPEFLANGLAVCRARRIA